MAGFLQLNSHEFHHVLEQQSGVSIIVFTGESCGSCHAWKQLLQDYQKNHAVAVFEIDAEREMALTNEFDVFHLPALFLYKDGCYHSLLQCEAKLSVLEKTVDDCLHKKAMEMP